MELKNIVPKKRHTNLKKSFCSEGENGIVNIVLLCICAFFFLWNMFVDGMIQQEKIVLLSDRTIRICIDSRSF